MKWILILWVMYGDGTISPKAEIKSIPMQTEAACQAALAKVKAAGRYINGTCVRGD